MKNKIIILVSMVFFLSLSFSSALFTAIDTIPSTSIDPGAKEYPALEITDWFGLDKVADMQLEKHMAVCGENCVSEWNVTLYEDAPLIDDIRFYLVNKDGSTNLKSIRGYTIYIQTGTDIKEVQDYQTQCLPSVAKNGTLTEICSDVNIGSHFEYNPSYTPYNLEDSIPPGTYHIRLEGRKSPAQSIDWQIKFNGKWIEEWSTWGSSAGLYDSANKVIYYKFNQGGSQTNVINTLPFQNGTLSTGQNFFASAFGTGYVNMTNFTTTSGVTLDANTNGSTLTQGNFSVEFRMKPGINSGNGIFSWGTPPLGWAMGFDGANKLAANIGACGQTNAMTPATTANTNHHVVMTSNGTGWLLYLDGVNTFNRTCDVSTFTANIKFGLDGSGGFGGFFVGGLDQFIVWNKTLNASDVIILNATTQDTPTASSVTLNSPANQFNTTSRNVLFNFSATVAGGSTLTNLSVWTNASGVFTISNTSTHTGTTNNTQLNVLFPADGDYIWNGQGCDSDGVCGITNSNRTLTIDSVAPTVRILYPTSTFGTATIGQNTSLNYSISDLHLNTCWFGYGSTNTTVNCAKNVTFTLGSTQTLLLYANDTFGNVNWSQVNWTYGGLITSQVIPTPVFVGSAVAYQVNISGVTPVSSASLFYNGTSYAGTLALNPDLTYTVSRTLVTPAAAANPDTKNVYWMITLNDGTQFNSTLVQQSVRPISVDACSPNNRTLYNFTIVDEDTFKLVNGTLNNTVIELTLNLYSSDGSVLVTTYSNNFTRINPAQICLPINALDNANFLSDVKLRYDADGYVSEAYNEQKTLITNSTVPRNINLYSLLSSRSQEFKLEFLDSSLLPLASQVLLVQRVYLFDNSTRTVEAPLTDNDGIALAHLVLSEVGYVMTLTKEGTIILSVAQPFASCDNIATGDCTHSYILHPDAPANPNYKNILGVQFTSIRFNESTRVASTTFQVVDGTTQLMSLNVTFGSSAVCSNSISSSTGNLQCTIPASYTNGTFQATLYKGNQPIHYILFDILESPASKFGNFRGVMVIGIVLTMVAMGVSSGGVMVVMALLGLVLSVGVGLITINDGSISGGVFGALLPIVGIILVYLWKTEKYREGA